MGERGRDAINVERLVAGPAGDVEAAAEIELGDRRADRFGNLAGMHDGDAMHFRERLRVEALRAGEHVKAAPVDAGLHQPSHYRRDARGVDAERTGDATQRNLTTFDAEWRRDPDRNLGLDADSFRGADRTDSLAFALDADRGTRLDRFLKFDVELPRAREIH